MTTTLSQSIQPQVRTIDGLSIRYAESEPRPDHALLLNPWPESLYAYEPTWSRLAEHAHLVAIDMPGFGHSEGRESLMSPRAMAEFVVRVADAFGLEQPHLVGMDVGCDAALFAAALHPVRFRSLVVGSGGTVFPLQWAAGSRNGSKPPISKRIAGSTVTRSSWARWRNSSGIRPRRPPARITSRPTQASASPSRCSTCEPTRRICQSCATSCRRSRRRCRSSLARETTSCRRSTPSISTSGCPRASSTSSTPGTLPGRTAADQYAALVTSWWAGGYAKV